MTRRLAILLVAGAWATAHASLSFGPVRNYPNIGLMFPCLDAAKAEPLPLPEARPYLLVGEDALAREDRFDPYELWYGLACCGRWRDAQGNRLVLGRATHLLPAFDEEEVSRARFAAALADEDQRVDPRRDEQVHEWVATFVAAPVYAPEPLRLNAFSLEEVWRYPCDATNTLVYAFRPRRVGYYASAPEWHCVTLHAPRAADWAAVRDRFEEEFLGRIKLPGRGAADEGVEAETLDVRQKGQKQPDQPFHPIRVDARKSVENYDAWWVAETDGIIILSDVHSEVGTSLIRTLQETLPALRQAALRLVPPLTREDDVALIRLFQSKDDYADYLGPAGRWTSGVWMPARRELVLAQEINTEEMLRVIRHEAFHQYLSHAYCMLPAAPWMNEGHACFFENASVDSRGHVHFHEDPARVAFLLENLEAAVAYLPRLLRLDYAAFYAESAAERTLHYALAWGLAYYLQKGAPTERNTPFRQILPDFAAALARERRYPEATARAFEAVDMKVFQSNFREFWLKRRAAAIQHDPLDQRP